MNNVFLLTKSRSRASRFGPFLCIKYPAFRPIWEQTLQLVEPSQYTTTMGLLMSALHPEVPEERILERAQEVRDELTKLMEHPTRWTEVSSDLVLKLCLIID